MGVLILPAITPSCEGDDGFDIDTVPLQPLSPPFSPTPSRPESPSLYKRVLNAFSSMPHLRRRPGAFLRRRANTVHGQPLPSDKHVQPDLLLLSRANTHPQSPRRRGRDLSMFNRSLAHRYSRGTNHNKHRQPILDRSTSALDGLQIQVGEAPASPHDQKSTKSSSPIETAAERIQEAGYSATEKALETVTSLLNRIATQQMGKEAVCNYAFITLIDCFERPSLDKAEEAFLVFKHLVLLGVMEYSEFGRAAKLLRDHGHRVGHEYLLRLINNDKWIKLNEVESREPAGVA